MNVYVAGPNGFTAAGLTWHTGTVLPSLLEAGFTPLDPWSGPAENWFSEAFAIDDLSDRIAAVSAVNRKVGLANAEMIERCDFVLANLEGVDVDSGTASEIGYACALHKPIVGFRPDLRTSGDNIGSTVNLQVEHFIFASGGSMVGSLDEAIRALRALR